MRFEHEGRSLWYGTADAPAPEQAQAGAETVITVGVWPVDPSNRVELLYRVNQGPIKTVAANWLRNDPSGKAQYFRLSLPGFHAGDTVEYIPFCGCAGRQVPSPDEASRFVSSFQVSDTEAKAAPDLAGRELFDQQKRGSESAQRARAVPRQPVLPPGSAVVPTGKDVAPRNRPTAGTVSLEPRPNGSASKKAPGSDVPLQQSPGSAEMRRVRTLEYAGLAGLDQRSANRLLEKNLTFDRLNEATLSSLVKEGVLSDSQESELQLTLELGRLTGDNLPFVSSLKTKGLKSTADLIGWEKEHWQQLITNERITLPPGETAESYGENILLNLERTYPSQLLFNRLLSDWQAKLALLDPPAKLPRKNDRLRRSINPAARDRSMVDTRQPTNLQTEPPDLTAFANTYRHLGALELLNDKNTDLSQKKNAIAARLRLLDAFYQNNPGLDLRLVNFFKSKDGNLNWGSIPTNERPLVRKQLMAYQRVLNLADSTDDRQALLSKGYDSAMMIAGQTETEFMRTSGLPAGKARMIYGRSQENALRVCLDCGAIQDVTRGGFTNIAMNNLPASLINDLREIDGFDDLFGPQDFCDCEACKSILSPAAYFVDLMSFIERHVSKPVFVTGAKTDSSLYLKNRRGDLWNLQLTCENTHAEIPYLTVVNEVLEHYLEKVVRGDIFERLSDRAAKISFALPFNLPLAELRLYLNHFGIRLHDVYRILKQDEVKVWRERLKLSPEDFALITTPDPTGVKSRFGDPSNWDNFPVQDFIRLAGITRQQLDELLTMRFNPDLSNIMVDKQSIPEELQNFPEILKNLTNNRADFIHRFIRLWQKTEWSIAELDLVLTTMREAGLVGTDFNGNNVEAVRYLARLIDIQEKLRLTVEEVCSLVDESPVVARVSPPFFASLPISREFPKQPAKQADRLLYERLFDLKRLFRERNTVTHELNTSTTFHHYSLNTDNPNDQAIDPNTPALLGGLGVSETELLLLFDLLKDQMPFDTHGDTTLDRQRISLLYRHARLAKALKLRIEDFIQTLQLNFGSDSRLVTTLEQIHQLIKFRDWLKPSPFTVPELRFILRGEEASIVKFKTSLETVGAVVLEIQNSQPWDKTVPEREGRIVQEVQNSQATNRTEGLKNSLSKFFNLTSDQLLEILNSVNIDINGSGIQTALTRHSRNQSVECTILADGQ